jgi:hypothetical protein
MKILSSDAVIEAAEKAGRLILETYLSPNRTFVDLPELINEMGPLRDLANSVAVNCSRQIGAETVTMPLLKYFGWVGSFLVAANWCFSMPIARSRPSA